MSWIAGLQRFMAVAATICIFLLVTTQVVARRVMDAPFLWSEELARYSLVWLAFASAGALMGDDKHITINLLDKALSRSGRRRLMFIATSITLIAVAVAVRPAWIFALNQAGTGSPATGWPLTVLYIAAPIGLFLVALHSIHNLVRLLRWDPLLLDTDIVGATSSEPPNVEIE